MFKLLTKAEVYSLIEEGVSALLEEDIFQNEDMHDDFTFSYDGPRSGIRISDGVRHCRVVVHKAD